MKFGAASVNISISDADGFRVIHGTDKTTLKHVPAANLGEDAWKILWRAIEEITKK